MKKTINLEMDLDREKAIEIILGDDSTISLNISIDCSYLTLDMINEVCDDEMMNIESFKEDCKNRVKKIQEERKVLESLPTHELYEKGEALGYWKLKEKQKRLI